MKRWVYKEQKAGELFQGIHKDIQMILRGRGLTTEEQMWEFLSDRPVLTYDPFLLKGMKEGVALILRHLNQKNRICIYGDYDVDGVTAVCLLTEFFENISADVIWYIPSRQEEGYGVNNKAIDWIKAQGAGLLITVDCGISAYEEVEYAKSLGMDVIVTDHHTVGDQIADTIVINPKQPGCGYPFKELCGCGVAYKLAQALRNTLRLPKSAINRGLDLVAVATVADIVPLVDENRTIIKYGLKRLRGGNRLGLNGLIRAIGLEERTVNAGQIAFIIGPHINAGGRVDTANDAMELLQAKDPEKIRVLAEKLVYNNNLRKSLQQEGYEMAREAIGPDPKDHILLVSGKDIHEGIAGIVAGKLKEEFYRPALIVTKSKEAGVLKGTGRSVEGLNLYELLKTQEPLMKAFGGHKAACGFSIEEKNLEAFREGLKVETDRIFQQNPGLFQESLLIDRVIQAEDITNEFAGLLEKLEPFGLQNTKPVFVCEDLYVTNVQFMGKQKEHVRFYAKDKMGKGVECVMFGGGEVFRENPLQGCIVDVAGVINMNHRGSSYNVQFILEDMRRR